jgi:hypothetical protein
MLKNLTAILIAMTQRAFSVEERQDFRCLYTDPPISFSEQFPDIPKPAPGLSPTILAAEWVLGDLHGEDMPVIAAHLLESGLDTPSMGRLAGETSVACRAEIEPIVGSMFRELSVPYPFPEAQALLIYSRQVAREVIHGERNAWAAASHLAIVKWPRKEGNPDIQALSELLDALDWNAVNHGTPPALTAGLIEVFARVGARAEGEKRPIRFGLLEGKGWIADDFDAPLPDELLALFEGRDDPPAE